jgi:hypothetical protein
MKQANLLILLSFALVLLNAQTIGTVGGYQTYTDLSSSQFQSVQSFIYAAHPEVKSYSTSTVSRQLVNGFNYNVTLSSAQGCQVVAVVYVPIQGSMSVTSYSALPCATLTSEPQVVKISPRPILAGGYTVQLNPSGAQF